MELTNVFYEYINSSANICHLTLDIYHLMILLSPFAPHLAEELWHQLGNKGPISQQPWPKYDPKLIEETELTIPIQVNGKLRDTITVAADAAEEEIKTKAQASEKIKSFIAGKTVVKIIVIPKKLINIVVK